MSKKTPCLVVPKTQGEIVRRKLIDLNLLDNARQIKQENDRLLFPLSQKPSDEQRKALESFEFSLDVCKFPTIKRPKPTTLKDILKTKLSPEKLEFAPSSYEMAGDIAVIEIPQELEDEKKIIGESLLNLHKHLNVVLGKKGAVSGEYRTRAFEVLAGENRTETIYKEHGCRYYVDLTQTYFSTRLSGERKRVAEQVKPNETIIDMFCGIGPFSILIAKTQPAINQIYAIDINPNAIKYLKKNIHLNKTQTKITPLEGNAKKIIPEKLMQKADRIIMNLPHSAHKFLKTAFKSLKPTGGTIHYYEITPEDKLFQKPLQHLEKAAKNTKKDIKILTKRKVRAYAPYVWHIGMDVSIR